MRRHVLFFLFVSLWPAAALAADLDADITLELPSDGSTYTVKSGGTFDQLSIGSDSFTFTAGNVDIRSGAKKNLSNNRNISTECLASESRLVISTTAGDTMVTPSGTCGGGGGGGSAGGGGGGGGGGAAAAPAAPAPATVDKVAQLKQQIAQVQAQIAQKLAQAGAPAAAVGIISDLAFGNRSQEVKALQQLLSQDKDIYPEGIASGYFGPATLGAVKRFQAKYGLPQVGRVGPQTRAKLAEVFGAAPSAAPEAPPAAAPAAEAAAPVSAVSAGIPSRDLDPGERNDEIRGLQELLAQDKDLYPEGLATGFFGPATTRAVKRFQEKYGLQAVGRVGPQTRAKLEEVFGSAAAPVPTPAPSAPSPIPAPAPSPAVAPAADAAAIQDQIRAIQAKLIQEQIKQIQEKIKALQQQQ